MVVQWGRAKATLLFFGLVFKGLSMKPLPIQNGELLQAIAQVVWPAFDGSFLWLLTPPTPKEDQNEQHD